jgi:hypothetical protein
MGNLRKIKRSIARQPERVWYANEKAKKDKLVAEGSALVEARKDEPTKPLREVLEEKKEA